MSITQLT